MAFDAVIDVDTLDGENGSTFEGATSGENAGWSVASAGDVNGDGIDDFIIGARGSAANGANSGTTYIVFGNAAGYPATFDLASLDGTNGFEVAGLAGGDRSGNSVFSAGDLNGDGIDDIVIGAFNADPASSGSGAGEAYVIFGTDAGFAASVDVSMLDGSDGFRIPGIDDNDDAAYSVSAAGDVNNDGIEDLIIGARFGDPAGGANAGEAYVIFGTDAGFGATFDLTSLDGTNGFTATGDGDGARLGFAVADAGDVNGDGIDDIIIGAPEAFNTGGDASGRAYVIFGSGSAFGATIAVTSLDGTNGFALDGVAAGDNAGLSVDGAGDINGDGIDDIIIGAGLADVSTEVDAGSSYIVYGTDAGFSAVVSLAALDGTNGFTVNGLAAGDELGNSVAGAGDVNGDGFDDFLIGAYRADPNGNNSGQTYLVFGTDAGFSATFDVSTLDGTNGFSIDGQGGQSGFSVATAGDVNNDGYSDLLIGARFANTEGGTVSSGGQVFLIYGDTSNQTEGTAGNDNLSGAGGNDTLNGFDGDDVLIGFNGNDTLNGGAGNDILSSGYGVNTSNGGVGDDQYFVFSAGDTLVENVGEGTDSVSSLVDWTLGDNFENLRLRGSASNGTGNELDNLIIGSLGGATLNGLAGNDALFGRGSADVLNGGDGDDRLNGQDGNDVLNGDAGNDSLRGGAGNDNLFGGADNDWLSGENGDDQLNGEEGTDRLFGGEGADTLNGGAGRDIMDGGAGADTFVFGAGDFAGLNAQTADRILDFVTEDGDLIDLSALDAIMGGGDDAFTFIADAEFSGTAGELRYEFFQNTTMIYMDVDGDGGADYAIRLDGVMNLSEADFVL